MTNQSKLDKYLNQSYNDGFDSFAESVINHISDDFYEQAVDWLTNCDYDSQCTKWLVKLYTHGMEWDTEYQQHCANVIERAYKLYKLREQ
jgi:hypothetical protein